jgi:hypothetical protein
MIDLVFTAMIVIVPILWTSVWFAHRKKNYERHKWTQIVLATVLGVTVLAFEIEMRLSGWRHLAEPSPFWKSGVGNDWIDYSLLVHLLFAIPTPFLWIVIIVRALRGFPVPAQPSGHSGTHKFWGQLGVFSMTATAITGWVFYYLAFVAS